MRVTWSRAMLGVALTVLALGTTGQAQRQSAATFPVIVVLDSTARLDEFLRLARFDVRAQGDPDAWGYLNPAVVGAVQALEAAHGFRAEHVFSSVLRGFAARLTANQIAILERLPLVKYVEADGTVQAVAQTIPWGIDRIDADISSTRAGNGSGTVTGVNAYVIDTGIDTRHTDLTVVRHVNFAGALGGGNTDCNGHGTHVAGTIGAKDNTANVVGVAPGVALTGVKVLGCNGSGSTSNVIKGIDWVTANAVKPAIANMSLGGGASQTLDDAVRRSVAAGVFYAIAAGNSSADACNSSPARVGAGLNGAMTVAATDSNNAEASFSNYGTCVDIWAPGVSILSTRRGGGTTTLSGTSMASPHVGGTGALYLSSHTSDNPAAVETALKASAIATNTVSRDGRAIKLVYAGGY